MNHSVSELRAELFGRVDAIAPLLAAEVDAAEAAGRLTDATVEAIRCARLLWLKAPAELGGYEAEPSLQFEVFERMARVHPAAAWCLFIYADTAGMITSRLSDDGVATYLDQGEVPVTAGGGGLRAGLLEAATGGYRLTGKFRYGSGITGAEWVLLGGLLDEDDGGGRLRQCVVRKDDLELLDNWAVIGMRGTGSMDYNANGVFVPTELTFVPGGRPLRGGRQYLTGVPGYLGYTIPAVAIGIARRALDAVMTAAATTTRGYSKPQTLLESSAFHSFVGIADQRLKAAGALMMRNGELLMEAIDVQGRSTQGQEAEVRAAAAFATCAATEVVTELVRYAGGGSMRSGAIVERALRDVTMAGTHLLVADSTFENHGRIELGLSADPMA